MSDFWNTFATNFGGFDGITYAIMAIIVVGAAFMIALQVSAILSYGTLSRVDVLRSEMLAAVAPELGSPLYWPARAMLGDLTALACVFTIGVTLLAAAVITLSPRFEDHVMDAAGVSSRGTRRRPTSRCFSCSARPRC